MGKLFLILIKGGRESRHKYWDPNYTILGYRIPILGYRIPFTIVLGYRMVSQNGVLIRWMDARAWEEEWKVDLLEAARSMEEGGRRGG